MAHAHITPEPSTDTPRPRRAALIVNARSRRSESVYERALELLSALGVWIEVARLVDTPDRLPEEVEHAVETGCERVIVAGGDGTVSAAVGVLTGRRATLGVLPTGTANDFARTLQIPTNLAQACETAAAETIVDVDLGVAGGVPYANVASVGLSAAVSGSVSTGLKRSLGVLAYPAATARALARHQPFIARLSFPAGDHLNREIDQLVQVSVGNGRYYGGGMAVAADAGIDDGLLDVYAVRLGPPAEMLRILRLLRTGEFVRRPSPLIYHATTQEVLVATEPALPLNLDGELRGETPATCHVLPNALRVLVPPESRAARLDGRQKEKG